MKLQSLASLEQSIVRRPKTPTPKRRHTLYLNPNESELLKAYTCDKDITVSEGGA